MYTWIPTKFEPNKLVWVKIYLDFLWMELRSVFSTVAIQYTNSLGITDGYKFIY